MTFNMPKVAIFFSLLLLSSTITHSYAYSIEELELSDKPQNSIIFNSDIIKINENNKNPNKSATLDIMV